MAHSDFFSEGQIFVLCMSKALLRILHPQRILKGRRLLISSQDRADPRKNPCSGQKLSRPSLSSSTNPL